MDPLSELDLHVFRERARTFCGSVKVSLDKLKHEETADPVRQPDESNIGRLVEIFERERCWPLDPENHIPALVPLSARSEVPQGNGDYPNFNPGQPLVYLHGYHRVEAARRFFTNTPGWWVVDLYSDDISERAKESLREREPNCRSPYNGDVLRQIRISIKRGDVERRDRYINKLPTGNMKELANRLDGQPMELQSAFDDLTPFRGFWAVNFLGTFGRMFSLHMPEELTRYLKRMKDIWTFIMGYILEDQLLLDPSTAYKLQGLCPGLSFEDREEVRARMMSGELFPAIKDQQRRSEIWRRLCSMDRIIPSFYTFVEHQKHLEVGSGILKKILMNKCDESLFQHFMRIHNKERNIKIQTGEFEFEDREFPSCRAAAEAGYHILWAFLLRHFTMNGHATRCDIGKRNASRPGFDHKWWAELPSVATQSGFRYICKLYENHKAADIMAIQEFVLKVLNPKYYNMDSEICQQKSKLIYQILFNEAEQKKVVPSLQKLASDHDNSRPGFENRCGRPRTSGLVEDEKYFFYNTLYASYDRTPAKYLTSFAVSRDFFLSFFGPDGYEGDLEVHAYNPGPDDRANRFESRDPAQFPTRGNRSRSPRRSPMRGTRIRERSPIFRRADELVVTNNHYFERNTTAVVVPYDASLADSIMDDEPSPLLQSPPTSPLGEQQDENQAIILRQTPENHLVSLAEASQYLYDERTATKALNVISQEGDNQFRIRRIDTSDTNSLIDALRFPSHIPFIVTDRGKRLKLSSSTAVLDDAISNSIETVVVPQQNSQDLANQLRVFEPGNHSSELVLFKNKPIKLCIWSVNKWVVVEDGITFNRTVSVVNEVIRNNPGFGPHDENGNALAAQECYMAAQRRLWPTVYFCRPEEAGSVFEEL